MITIKKRKTFNDSGLFLIAFTPSMTYLLGKIAGVKYNHLEFTWWIAIPALWIVVFFAKYKIVKKEVPHA